MGSSDHQVKPFKVTLGDTDRLSYVAGDSILFTVVIENTGKGPIVLGTSRDREVAPKTMSPCRVVPPGVHFNVALTARDKKGSRAILATGPGFYGSADVAGTTFVVQPGERVRVQLAAQIYTGPGFDPPLSVDPRPVRLQAFVMIERDHMVAEYSGNTLEVELAVR